MKKTVNKWLLLFASIFLMTAVACSNSAGGGDGNNDTPETPETPAETFKGIKIQIPASSIPADAMVREVYVNDEKVSSESNNSHVRDTEWGYPFVDAGKSYEVYAKYINSSWETVLTTETVTIQAESGLGELTCNNVTHSVSTNNKLILSSTPIVSYGNTNFCNYPNQKANTKPNFILDLIKNNPYDYISWNCLYSGRNFSYNNDFNFAQHLKENVTSESDLSFELYCSIEDKDYGSYRYTIFKNADTHFTLTPVSADSYDPTASNQTAPEEFVNKIYRTESRCELYAYNDIEHKYYVFDNAVSSSDANVINGKVYYYFYNKDGTRYSDVSYPNEPTKDFSYNKTAGIGLSSGHGTYLMTKHGNDYYSYMNSPIQKDSGSGMNITYKMEVTSESMTMSLTEFGAFSYSYIIQLDNGENFEQSASGTYENNGGILTFHSEGIPLGFAIHAGDSLYLVDEKFSPVTELPTN